MPKHNLSERLINQFFDAVSHDSRDTIRQLLTQYPNLLNQPNDLDGNTALHIAILNRNISLVKFLIEHGCEINIKNKRDGDTPLHLAIHASSKDIVTLLLKNNASVTEANNQNKTPLDIAKAQLSSTTDMDMRKILGDIIGLLEVQTTNTIQSTTPLQHDTPSQSHIHVPKIIHFVWAGGEKMMPDSSISVVSEWAKQNPRFAIYLWVDAKTSGKSGTDQEKLIHMAKEYFEIFKEYLGAETKISYQSNHFGQTNQTTARIILKDIEEEKVSDKCVRYEIERARPNYGASSDKLRYRILYLFGGAYFDSDIKPPGSSTSLINPVQLQNFPIFHNPLQEHHLFFLEHQTQLPNKALSSDTLTTFNLTQNSRIGNDAFICTVSNPVMKCIVDEVDQNYRSDPGHLANKADIKKTPRVNLLMTMTYGASDRRFTIFMTGPEQIRFVLNKVLVLEQGKSKEEILALQKTVTHSRKAQPTGSIQKKDIPQTLDDTDDTNFGDLFDSPEERNPFGPEEQTIQTTLLSSLRPLRCQSYCLTDPLPNTLNCLKPIINRQDNQGMAMACIKNAIIFEANQFKILRLEDHIIDLKIMLDKIAGQPVPIKEVIALILDELGQLIKSQQIHLEEIQCAQCLLQHPEVSNFYSQHDLLNRTFLKEHITLVIPHACSLSIMHEINQSININKDFDLPILKEAIFRMELGLKFISNLIDNHRIAANYQINIDSDTITGCLTIFKTYEEAISKISQSSYTDDLSEKSVQINVDLTSTKSKLEGLSSPKPSV